MQGWRLGFLGIESIPPWLGEFEVEQFFRLSPAEIATVKTRRGDQKQLGLALHVGFLRMSGRQLNSTDVIHWRILSFLGAQLDVSAPRVASLRALYPRRPTLHEHQRLAKALLGFRKMTEPVRRQLVGHFRQTRGSASEPAELLINARQWLYEHRYLIGSERELLDTCRAVLVDHKSKLVKEIGKLIPLRQRKRWVAELSKIRPELGDRTYLEWCRVPYEMAVRSVQDGNASYVLMPTSGTDVQLKYKVCGVDRGTMLLSFVSSIAVVIHASTDVERSMDEVRIARRPCI